MRPITAACAVLALAACSRPAQPPAAKPEASPAAAATSPVPTPAPPGRYYLDKPHTSLNFRALHMGISHFTTRFTRLDGTLDFDPAHPERMKVDAEIDPTSIQTNYPFPQKLDFDAQVRSEFLQPDRFPKIEFRSTKVESTGPNSARVTGDLTLHGVTRPVTLQTTFNGGYAPTSFDPGGARIGFSAHGSFSRTDFGITYGIPPKGTNLGVGDEVEVMIETEFTSKKQS